MNIRQLFLQHNAQTSPAPIALHITKAKGSYLYDVDDNKYLDLIGGISVCNLGHSQPKIIEAVKKQIENYMHIMVYGELIQSPQTEYAALLTKHLPPHLNTVYFTNSGTEATEGAIKLARRITGRPQIIACHNSYHGSTLGALSVMGDEYWRNSFRPLLPGCNHYSYNSHELIEAINTNTACVLLETIQAEAGVIAPHKDWLKKVQQKCNEYGVLLILDEIQCGFGRTGKLWGFEHFDVQADIILLGKALGGGMPLGAFISSHENMQTLTHAPVLGHISTFGGHPVCCAAGMAAMNLLIEKGVISEISIKVEKFIQLLKHRKIKAVRHVGLLMAIELESSDAVMACLQKCLNKGVFSDWFLFAPNCIRLAPPLTITIEEIEYGCTQILDSL